MHGRVGHDINTHLSTSSINLSTVLGHKQDVAG